MTIPGGESKEIIKSMEVRMYMDCLPGDNRIKLKVKFKKVSSKVMESLDHAVEHGLSSTGSREPVGLT